MTVRTLRLILGDQLSHSIITLAEANKQRDVILLAEVMAEATYVAHHKKKIVFVFSAMRHFAEELRAAGWNVRYSQLDAPHNTGSLFGEVERTLRDDACDRLHVAEAGEWRLAEEMAQWAGRLGCDVTILEDARFYASHQNFLQYSDGRKDLLMENFYRSIRKSENILMEGAKPAGGRWNYDAENRKRLPRSIRLPARSSFPPDVMTQAVMQMVAERFPNNFGDIEPFDLPVTRSDALAALDDFIEKRLKQFGEYQDAMAFDEPTLFHSRLSAALNIGLLSPREIVQAAEAAYREGKAPLKSVEGFIRQIAGWREYIRGVYWAKMPNYAEMNALDAAGDLPGFYWNAQTDMACIADVIATTRKHAFAHHIQRLMVTGNFALLAGLAPTQVAQWYLLVYCDAYEWVELPNVFGMALYADGGMMASKPYAASGAYINRMSNYCSSCRYDVKQRLGPDACPFNALYWDFLARNRKKLGLNPRLAMPYRNLDGMEPAEITALRDQAERFIASLSPNY